MSNSHLIRTFKFLLWEPESGDRKVVKSEAMTFPEAVGGAYIEQKALMSRTSKTYRIVNAVDTAYRPQD